MRDLGPTYRRSVESSANPTVYTFEKRKPGNYTRVQVLYPDRQRKSSGESATSVPGADTGIVRFRRAIFDL